MGIPRLLVSNAGPPVATEFTVAQGLAVAAGSMAEVTEQWLARFGDTAEAVVFIASIAGTFGATPGANAWYAAAKAAVTAYAGEVAVHRKGRPRANVVAPGPTVTARTQGLIDSDVGRRIAERVPLARFGEPHELAAAICFLLSPAASYVNGALLPVDGGVHWAP
jgi:NAD(P)-dependent dehydrogenase (short-subunit alcohol dehydrogenase family)